MAYSPLDVEVGRWALDFAVFTTAIDGLERKLLTAARAAIERAGSLQARTQLIMVRAWIIIFCFMQIDYGAC